MLSIQDKEKLRKAGYVTITMREQLGRDILSAPLIEGETETIIDLMRYTLRKEVLREPELRRLVRLYYDIQARQDRENKICEKCENYDVEEDCLTDDCPGYCQKLEEVVK